MPSPVQRVNQQTVLGNHEERLRLSEFSGERWIYVGTVGVDGIDNLITPDSPPFQNDWTQAGGGEQYLSFILRANTWLHIRGVPTGGADETVVFTLPVECRPKKVEHFSSAGRDPGSAITWRVEPSGDVIYETQVSGADCNCGDPDAGGFIQFDVDNVGDWLQIETTDLVPGTTFGDIGIQLLATGGDHGAVFGSSGNGNTYLTANTGSIYLTGPGGGPLTSSVYFVGDNSSTYLSVSGFKGGMDFLNGGYTNFAVAGFEVDSTLGIYLSDVGVGGISVNTFGGGIAASGDWIEMTSTSFNPTPVQIGGPFGVTTYWSIALQTTGTGTLGIGSEDTIYVVAPDIFIRADGPVGGFFEIVSSDVLDITSLNGQITIAADFIQMGGGGLEIDINGFGGIDATADYLSLVAPGTSGISLAATATGGPGGIYLSANDDGVSTSQGVVVESAGDNNSGIYVHTLGAPNNGIYLRAEGAANGGVFLQTLDVNNGGILLVAEGAGNNGIELTVKDGVDITLNLVGGGGKVQIKDSSTNPIFEVRDDGSLHGKTGQALTFDL